MAQPQTQAKFERGKLVVTEGIANRMVVDDDFSNFISDCLARHLAGDWGDAGDETKAANESALKDGDRLFSIYDYSDNDTRIWIITEGNRSATTVLLPEEY